MNDYKHTFGLNTNQDINKFIYDFLDHGLFYRTFGFRAIDGTDFINGKHLPVKKRLTNKRLINKFIDDFTQSDKVDEAYKIATRRWEEKEMGIDIFREEHERSMLKMEEKKLKSIFHKYLN